MDGQADGRRVEKSRRSRCPGRVVRIDLGDGRCAYGRQLFSVQVEFYDLCRAKTRRAICDLVIHRYRR
jgi:hypothetical protein